MSEVLWAVVLLVFVPLFVYPWMVYVGAKLWAFGRLRGLQAYREHRRRLRQCPNNPVTREE